MNCTLPFAVVQSSLSMCSCMRVCLKCRRGVYFDRSCRQSATVMITACGELASNVFWPRRVDAQYNRLSGNKKNAHMEDKSRS